MPIRRCFLPLGSLILLLATIVPVATIRATSPIWNDQIQVRRPATTAHVPGEIIVRLRDDQAAQRLGGVAALRTRLGALRLGAAEPVLPHTYRLQVDQNVDLAAVAERIAADPAVAYAQPNSYVSAHRIVNDPLSTFQYNLPRIDAAGAWTRTTGSSAITIAVIDTGVLPDHPELAGRVLPGYDFINNDADATDDEGHGTHTAGIIAAAGDNGEGIAGLCWQCRVLPVKVLNNDGIGTDVAVAQGIRWAADNGARIINLSLGGPGDPRRGGQPDPLLREAVQYAASKNVLMVASAGNTGDLDNQPEFPAALDEVMAVGATDEGDRRAFFSQIQSYVDISAPGVNIPSLSNPRFEPYRSSYVALSGTSEAAPQVAGVAGLMLSLNPSLSAASLRSLLAASADDLGTPGVDPEYGAGRLNAGRALATIQGNDAYAPVADPAQPGVLYFGETQHTLRGEFRRFWEGNGGLAVFGFPLSEEFVETTPEGSFLVQYFERNRFEFHPENAPPYNVLLGRLSDQLLLNSGRNWFTFPKGQPAEGCQFFAETGHSVCEPFLSYWQRNGLRDPQLPPDGQSLALFGLPLSEPAPEINSSGENVVTQWFERARFEFHPDKPVPFQVLLGRLGAELPRTIGQPPIVPPSGQTPPDRCAAIPPAANGTIRPACMVVGTVFSIEGVGFQPNEVIDITVVAASGERFPQTPLFPIRTGGDGVVRIQGDWLGAGDFVVEIRGRSSGVVATLPFRYVDR